MSNFSSTIAEKKRIILKNIDGSYSHCYKTGEKDSIAEIKIVVENNDNQHNQNPNDDLTISDSELQYIIENYDQFDYNSIIEQLLSVFRRNQLIFLFILSVEMSMTCFLLFITWQKKENSIIMLQDIYKDLSAKEASILFYMVFVISLILNAFFYPLGFYSLVTKKVHIFRTFSSYCLYTAILTVFIIYLNILFIVLFIVRLVIYGFSRFLINLLISILILPRHPLTSNIPPNSVPNTDADGNNHSNPNSNPNNNNRNYDSI